MTNENDIAHLRTDDLGGGDLDGAGRDAEVARVVRRGAADAAEQRLVVLHERLLGVIGRAGVTHVRRARQLLLTVSGLEMGMQCTLYRPSRLQ